MIDQKLLQAIGAEVAAILWAERKKRGLSLAIVAERSGLSLSMVSFVERETRHPTIETLVRICWALGINPVEVLRRATKAAAQDQGD